MSSTKSPKSPKEGDVVYVFDSKINQHIESIKSIADGTKYQVVYKGNNGQTLHASNLKKTSPGKWTYKSVPRGGTKRRNKARKDQKRRKTQKNT